MSRSQSGSTSGAAGGLDAAEVDDVVVAEGGEQSAVTVALAAASSPETNTVLLAPRACGCTMTSAVIVLSVLTTRAFRD